MLMQFKFLPLVLEGVKEKRICTLLTSCFSCTDANLIYQ